MDIKKILLISLIAVAIVASVSIVSAGLFDGLFGEEEHPDNVVELDEITFNTTNVTKFKKTDKDNSKGGYSKRYKDENETGYVAIIYCWKNYDADRFVKKSLPAYKSFHDFDNLAKQTINDTVVYSCTAKSGKHEGEPYYLSYVVDVESRRVVEFRSLNCNETAKMASTMKFNK